MPVDKDTVEKLKELRHSNPIAFQKMFSRMIKSLSTSDLVVLRWHLMRRDKQTPPDPLSTIWWLLGGRGCIAAGTPVWDPSINKYRLVEKMTEPGWVLTTQGPAIASPSYIKGVAPLYRVETDRGDVILTTAEHRFLTPMGYIPLRDIGIGDEILSLDPSKLPLSDQHLMDRVSDSRLDYRQQSHLYDQQLHQAQVNVLERFPLPIDALEHIQASFYLDDSRLSHEHIPDPEFALPSNGYSFQDEAQEEVYQLPPQLLSDERFQQRLLATLRFLYMTYSHIDSNQYGVQSEATLPFCEFGPPFSYNHEARRPLPETFFEESCTGSQHGLPRPSKAIHLLNTDERLPQVNDTFCSPMATFHSSLVNFVSTGRVLSVKFVGNQEFYDLHVPGPNNYLAAGMFHSNSGKTFTAANHIYDFSVNLPFVEANEVVYIALIGSIYDDVKNTMIEGLSGLLKIIPEEDVLKWNRTNGELSWRVIGPEGQMREVRANAYTSEKPDKLRGPNLHAAWLDEFAKFKDANEDPTRAGTTWNNLMLGLRNGTKPHVLVTGTPTDCRLSKYLLAHPSMKMSHMTTIDNRKNLPESFFDEINLMDPSSRTYRQEVLAELIFDNPDAIFNQETIDLFRAPVPDEADIVYKVLGYDPALSSAADADECGLVLTAYTPEVKEKTRETGGRPRIVKPTHAYILKDLSGHYTPKEQTELVIQTMLNEGVNDLVYEQNAGVEFVMQSLEQALKDNVLEYYIRKQPKAKKTDYGIVKRWQVSGVDSNGMSFKFMIYAVHATSEKKLRAEMVSTRYDSGQIHHPLRENPLSTCPIQTCQANLENQMTSWSKKSRYSPDRLDAMGYSMLHIFANFMITRSKVTISRPPGITQEGSQHQAVKPKRKGRAGIYAADFDRSAPGDIAERSLIPYLDGDGMRGRNPYTG